MAKKSKKNYLNLLEHYWMCDDCAKRMGGVFPEGHICTVCKGKCEYCGTENVTLTPWVDYNWKSDKKLDKIAKANRD